MPAIPWAVIFQAIGALLLQKLPDLWDRFWEWRDEKNVAKIEKRQAKRDLRAALRRAKKLQVERMLEDVENDDTIALLRDANAVLRDPKDDNTEHHAP